MNFNKYLSVFLLFLCLKSFGHGEDKVGPHQGYIRMPGAFHTEVKVMSKTALRIYLLDIQWKNPVVSNSTVVAKYTNESSSDELSCKPIKDYFECQLPSYFNAKKGFIEIKAKRDGQEGGLATYELPLKLFKSPDSPSKNQSHKGHGDHAH